PPYTSSLSLHDALPISTAPSSLVLRLWSFVPKLHQPPGREQRQRAIQQQVVAHGHAELPALPREVEGDPAPGDQVYQPAAKQPPDRKSTRLNSSHLGIS